MNETQKKGSQGLLMQKKKKETQQIKHFLPSYISSSKIKDENSKAKLATRNLRISCSSLSQITISRFNLLWKFSLLKLLLLISIDQQQRSIIGMHIVIRIKSYQFPSFELLLSWFISSFANSSRMARCRSFIALKMN